MLLRAYGWRALAVYSGKDALLARDRRGEAFSHSHTCVSKFSGVQERERNKHAIAIESFGRQNVLSVFITVLHEVCL